MYNHLIDTFLMVADKGSFLQAAERLNMVPTTVMNQINALEDQLGVNLFMRTTKGVKMTKEGRYLYQQANRLIEASFQIKSEIRHQKENGTKIIRLGILTMNPLEEFSNIWQKSPHVADFSLLLVNYSADINVLGSSSETMYSTADVGFASEIPSESEVKTEILIYGEYKLTLAVPTNHPLAKKKKLELFDLKGESILFPSRGNRTLAEQLSVSLTKTDLDVKIETPNLFYDLDIINHCAEERKLLISLDCWDHIHPSLVNIPVRWDWKMPYGLIWKKNDRKEIQDFIAAFKEALEIYRGK